MKKLWHFTLNEFFYTSSGSSTKWSYKEKPEHFLDSLEFVSYNLSEHVIGEWMMKHSLLLYLLSNVLKNWNF